MTITRTNLNRRLISRRLHPSNSQLRECAKCYQVATVGRLCFDHWRQRVFTAVWVGFEEVAS